jgi:CubicO group peptidase (beta-lactamase class C family)
MIKKTVTTLTLLCTVLSSAVFASEPTLDFSQLQIQLTEQMQELNIPGAQVAVFNEKTLLWQGNFGHSDAAEQSVVTSDTLFRAGSTTKTFIALAVMQLANQGKFSLQDDINALEPSLKIMNPWQSSEPVRVINLLEHTAGFDDMHFRNFYNVSEPDISLLDAVNRDAAALQVRWQPGTRFAYSNPGYGILGHLIEKYSGQPFEQYIAQQVLQPLGIKQCQLNSGFQSETMLSDGFVKDEAVAFRQIYLRAAGNLHCTATGLSQLGIWMLSQGQSANLAYLSSDTISRMELPESTLAAKQGLQFGYSKAISQSQRDGIIWHGHSGGIDGFITYYGYSRQLQLGYVVMMNTSSVSLKKVTNIITTFLSDDPVQQQAQLETIDIRELDGYYRVANDRNQIFAGVTFSLAVAKLTTKGTTLVVDPLLGSASEYDYLGNGQFANSGESHANTIVIGNTNDGYAIDIDSDYLLKISAVGAWLPIIILGFILLIFLLTLCYAPFWIINSLRGKISSRQQLWLRLLPFFNTLVLGAVIIALFNLSLFTTSQINWQTMTIYLGTIAFAAIGLATTWFVVKQRHQEPSGAARYFAIISAVSANTFALYCYHFDYLGLALWQW